MEANKTDFELLIEAINLKLFVAGKINYTGTDADAFKKGVVQTLTELLVLGDQIKNKGAENGEKQAAHTCR